jgi:hypothetical protein
VKPEISYQVSDLLKVISIIAHRNEGDVSWQEIVILHLALEDVKSEISYDGTRCHHPPEYADVLPHSQ